MFKVTFSSAEPLKAQFGGDSTFEPQMSEVIYVPVGETYDGSYDITPTEETQTLATEGLLSAQDFVIEAIPSNYVGSAIERRTESDISISGASDLSVSGATVSVPGGYYSADASKTISDATLRGGSRIEYDPTILVDENGLVTASYDHSTTISPINGNGYITTGARYSVRVVGTKTYQLTDGDVMSFGIVPLVGSAKVGQSALCEEE